ncbi:MAG: nuclease [Thermoanaerobaculia bacterium]|nr:MAG: nuclease [Thermoanaerobaculia bacterium]
MRRFLSHLGLAGALWLATTVAVQAQVIINELDSDTPGTDAAEFVELFDGGAGNTSLNGLVVVFYNGSVNTSYAAFDLDGFSTDANGYFLLGNAAVPGVDLVFAGNLLQNGQDAAAIYVGDAGSFPNGSPITTVGLVDAVVYDTSDPDDPELLVLLNPGEPQVDENANATSATESIGRCPNGSGGARNTSTYGTLVPTPDGSNTCGGSGPTLSINDVSLSEGDAGFTDFTFTISVTGTPAGTVTFDATVDDGTATVADNDYVDQNGVPLSIVPPATSTTFTVQVVGDVTNEPTETFSVVLANLVNADPGDTTGTGTILNDDVVLTPLHDIQGNGASSPLVGQVVTTRGLVTGVKSNGFFLQAADADADPDPATSEGIFVFTSSAPAVAVGDEARVAGTVVEFVPPADPFQPPLTELGNPGLSVAVLSGGNPLPTPVPLTPTFPDPAGAFDQLERLEGMRVSVASFTVAGPTLGSISETNATATSNGVFYGVVTGVARPFREPGVQLPDPLPAGSPANVPRFDTNPEALRVDSDVLGHAAVETGTGAILGSLAGPLDFGFRHYTIALEAGAVVTGAAQPEPAGVSARGPLELTVAGYNLQRFFDDVDDPGISEPVLTAAAFDARLAKASEGIRDYLGFPDVIGVAECENQATLAALAARVNADAVAAGQGDPQYVAHLLEGHDVGGIDVGYLVKTAPVSGSVPRVEVLDVAQEGYDTLFVNPDLSSEFLNDRPALRLDAVVHFASADSFPLTVIVNHLRSLSGVNSESAGSNGWTTVGERVRAKRQQQAEELAGIVQARQVADPAEWLVMVGDFNAFEFNDGFGDSMGTILGAPAPDDETVVPGDGADLVEPDLVLLAPAGAYSYVFDGNAQSLDHALANAALVAASAAVRGEIAHLNADFAETVRNDDTTVARLSDHDPEVAFVRPAALDPERLFRGDFESGDTRWWSSAVE